MLKYLWEAEKVWIHHRTFMWFNGLSNQNGTIPPSVAIAKSE